MFNFGGGGGKNFVVEAYDSSLEFAELQRYRHHWNLIGVHCSVAILETDPDSAFWWFATEVREQARKARRF